MAEKSLIGGLAGLDSGNDDNLRRLDYAPGVTKMLGQYKSFFDPKALRDIIAQYTSAYNANAPEAAANAEYYKTAGKSIFEDPSTYLGDYEKLRGGNLDALNGVYKNVLDYGLAGIKGRLAAGGYGNQGPSSYDRILNAQMTTSNIAPVLQTIFGNLGGSAAQSYGSRMANNQNKLQLMANDFLTRYADNNAARTLTPYLTGTGVAGSNIGGLNSIIDAIKNGVAGYQLEKGLTTRLDESAEGVQNAMKFASQFMGGGMGGMMGGMGGAAGAAGGAGGAAGGTGNIMSMLSSMGGGSAPVSGGSNMNQIMAMVQQMLAQRGSAPAAPTTPAPNYWDSNPALLY